MVVGVGIGGIVVKNGLLNYIFWIGVFVFVVFVVVIVVDNVLFKWK